ncbi:MAG: DUF3180 domain-containing protein [Microbacteriaceae bacterium]|nr:DUF3180 domain-containing protein [Microbacteriaceae bacterium]
MKRTNLLFLLGLTPIGFGVGFGIDWALVSRGGTAIPVPWTLSVSLVLMGVAVVALGARVRAAVKPVTGRRIDPIAAVTIVQLAKASAVGGALLCGATTGLLAFVATRPVVVDTVIPSNIGGVVAALILVVLALVAESMCVLPPQDPDGEPA